MMSILIPTLDEADNIDPLLRRILDVLVTAGLDGEVLVVDGGSSDGTQERVRAWACGHPVRLVEADARRGLSGDILHGAAAARGEIVVVMDADLSHPPETIPALVQPLLAGTHDVVVGSRYIRGGGTPGWPWTRALASRAATALAWPLVSVHDPMSGFFAVRRELLLELGKEAAGFKITLEILVRGDDALRVKEVPIIFHDRERGQSKCGLREARTYLRQLLALAGGAVSTGHTLRFASVGLLGMAIDLAVFNLLLAWGFGVAPAHVTSFAAATLSNYLGNARWAFADTAGCGADTGWRRYLRYLVVCLLALFLRGLVISTLVDAALLSPRLAIVLGIVAATAVNFIGTAFFIFPRGAGAATPAIRWRVFALGVVSYVVVLRLVASSVIDLIPEEAYYWAYSRQPDIGYLDHPPLVAWLIALGTWLLGNHEIGVRLPALLCWLVAAGFMFGLTQNLFGKTAAFLATLLLAVLPIYFGVGFLMVPDAPLYAAWAGCLYFLERALLAERQQAWWGVGVCVGLGMLAKYTMALLGPATLAFVLLDRSSRRWLVRPAPYLAAVLAIVLFSPVIFWNATHDWASFAFQGPRRWSGETDFSLHLVVFSALVLLTPIGLIAAGGALASCRAGAQSAAEAEVQERRRRFTWVFTLVPLSVFVLHSLVHSPKLNWTGPVWLATIPLLAWTIAPLEGRMANWLTAFNQRVWRPTVVALLLLYGGGLYYLLLGQPGLPLRAGMPLPTAWEEMAAAIEEIDVRLEVETGAEPVVVGMNAYFISSQHAFYDPDHDGWEETSGRHLFDRNSLMWAYWKPRSAAIGKTILMVGFEPNRLSGAAIDRWFSRTSAVEQKDIVKNGRVVGRFYYRIGYNYQASQSPLGARPDVG